LSDNVVKIISAGAPKLGVRRCANFFEKNSDISVRIIFATAPEITKPILSEECSSDIIIAPDLIVSKFEKSGHVIELSGTTIGSVKVAVVVKQGAIEPNISSKKELKRAMLTSKRIIFNEASSGQYISSMIDTMGIRKGISNNILITKTGSDVIEYLDQSLSNNEIGFSQATEIQLKINEGMNVRLLGTLPREIEHIISYKSALLTTSANKKAARDMLHFMSSNAAKRICITSGLL
jgi:ABC-type molybdate transport system substrate-binding protein